MISKYNTEMTGKLSKLLANQKMFDAVHEELLSCNFPDNVILNSLSMSGFFIVADFSIPSWDAMKICIPIINPLEIAKTDSQSSPVPYELLKNNAMISPLPNRVFKFSDEAVGMYCLVNNDGKQYLVCCRFSVVK